jgi:hypothetical protein
MEACLTGNASLAKTIFTRSSSRFQKELVAIANRLELSSHQFAFLHHLKW